MTADYNYCRSVGAELEKVFPFWEELCAPERDRLCRCTAHAVYKRDTGIHGGDGECTGVVIVKSGCIRAYMLSEGGREITLYRLYPGDVCMLSASCVLQSITFDVMVDAVEDSECYVVNGKAFSDVAEKNLHVKNYALETAVKRFSEVMWVMQQILFMSFDKRLAIFLVSESLKSENGVINLTNEQIAKYMGSAREVVSRMMKYFINDKTVVRKADGIHITDIKKLRRLAL